MTTTFAQTLDNDFVLTPQGLVSVVTGDAAVSADARSAVQAQRGEMVLAMAEGMPTMAVAFNGWRPGQFEAAARQVMLKVPGVRSVPRLDVSRDGEALRYDATIQSDAGTVIVNG
ncbi:MAG: hypothetical protein RSG92_15180 [Pseudomonas sp.]